MAPTDDAARVDALLADLARIDNADWERAEEELQKIWSRSGSAAVDLLTRRGRDAINEGDFPKAIAHLSAAIELAPDFAEAWNARATAFFLMDRFGLSLEDLSQALSLNPRQYRALYGLGVMLEALGRHEDALAAFRESHAINPHQEQLEDAMERLGRAVDGMDL
ncbi:MAG: tetratricopeptide repeat protein [Pseudomonadota bacterium]